MSILIVTVTTSLYNNNNNNNNSYYYNDIIIILYTNNDNNINHIIIHIIMLRLQCYCHRVVVRGLSHYITIMSLYYDNIIIMLSLQGYYYNYIYNINYYVIFTMLL